MASVRGSKTITVSIACPPQTVYRFVANPENLASWATTFCRSVKRSQEKWIVETPDGFVEIEFMPDNDLGVLDHYVRLANEQVILNPMRVVANGSGSEVMFTLFQLPSMSDEQFHTDITLVERDLQTLRELLEQRA